MTKKKTSSRTEKTRDVDESNRDVYVFGRLENEVAMPVIRRLLKLAERDARAPINLYINSSGGNGYNADAIIAIMHSISPKVNTICLGHALSGACEILASGTGDRSSYEFATLMFHQTIWEAEGDITSLEIQATQGKRFREAQIELLHRCTGQDKEVIRKDIERDHYLSADEAQEYGIIDKVIKHQSRAKRKLTLAASNAGQAARKSTARKRASAVKPAGGARKSTRSVRSKTVKKRASSSRAKRQESN